MKKYIIPLLIITALIIAGCNGSDTEPTPTPTPTPTEAAEQAQAGDTVKVHYTGTYDDGAEFDSSYGRGEPLQFTVAAGQMIPGFDKAVEGMYVGDTKTIRLAPEDAYGERSEDLIQEVSRDELPEGMDPQIGDMLQNIYGQPLLVIDVSNTTITIDANHPLAGEYLNFDIELVGIVNKATPTPVPTPFEGPTTYLALINTSMGSITLELYRDKVPTTVDNFVKLAQDGFYDGIIFHRISDDFMIQAGNTYPDGSTKESPYGNIEFETSDLAHEDGAISMASTGWAVGGSAQFFICDGAQNSLNGGYAVFGVVTEGIEVVRDIAAQPHDDSSSAGGGVPLTQIIINSIEIQEGS